VAHHRHSTVTCPLGFSLSLLVVGLSLSCATNEMMEPRFQGLENRIQSVESAATSLETKWTSSERDSRAALSSLEDQLLQGDRQILESLRADTTDALSKVEGVGRSERALLTSQIDDLQKKAQTGYLQREALRGSLEAQVRVLTQQVALTQDSQVDAKREEAGQLERILKGQAQDKLETVAAKSHFTSLIAGVVTKKWVEDRMVEKAKRAEQKVALKVDEATGWRGGDTAMLTTVLIALVTSLTTMVKQRKGL